MELRRACLPHSSADLPTRQRDPVRALPALTGRMKLAVMAGAALLAVLTSSEARAEFTVCNQTLDVVNLAVGQRVDNADQTDGWWTIGANQCVNVIPRGTDEPLHLHLCTDVFGHAILTGFHRNVHRATTFLDRGIDECWQRGHIAAQFLEVDTLEQVRWTFLLTGSNP